MRPASVSQTKPQQQRGLLDVLLRVQHQVQPAAYVSLQDAYDAFLLIGNDGLRQRGGARGFAYTYDLGAEWHAWTGLPFVFSAGSCARTRIPKP